MEAGERSLRVPWEGSIGTQALRETDKRAQGVCVHVIMLDCFLSVARRGVGLGSRGVSMGTRGVGLGWGDVTLPSNIIKQFHTSLVVFNRQKVHLKKTKQNKNLRISWEIQSNVKSFPVLWTRPISLSGRRHWFFAFIRMYIFDGYLSI